MNLKKSPPEFDTPANQMLVEDEKKNIAPVKTIPYGKPAKDVNTNINSLGENIFKDVALSTFPFKVTRCDQIVLFPAEYINNEDDYRVRKSGFVAITAHFTNLFNSHDGQKLIQHVISSTAQSLPSLLPGARGCIKVPGDRTQKNLNICTHSLEDAKNLLVVYDDFARCRLGDNLQPIPPNVLRDLLQLCGVSKVSMTGKHAKEAMNKLNKMLNERNERMREKMEDKLEGNETEEERQKREEERYRRKRKHKRIPPQFFLPESEGNEWEKDRMRYVHFSRIRVPGTRR